MPMPRGGFFLAQGLADCTVRARFRTQRLTVEFFLGLLFHFIERGDVSWGDRLKAVVRTAPPKGGTPNLKAGLRT